MKDDLISRKAVAEKMKNRRDYVGRPSDPDCIIADEPSVPAVQLDKLCEWLAKYGYPCAIIDTEQCNLQECDVGISYSQEASRNCWKTILTNWMEEQDAVD